MSLAEHELGQFAAEVPPRPGAGGAYERIKPALDIALGSILLILTAPVMIAAMLLVRLTSPGGAIYTQRRLGRGGKEFTIYKIRTMYADCERVSGRTWSPPGDPRVTPVGRVLRSTHLDELPQLINVLLGEMSLVGPRPERPEFLPRLERDVPNYRRRLAVRPGVTGLAQVQHPPDTDVESVRRKLQYDLCYVGRMSPWLDLCVIFATALKCVGVPLARIGRWLRLPSPDGRVEPVAPQGRPHEKEFPMVRLNRKRAAARSQADQKPPRPSISPEAGPLRCISPDCREVSSGPNDHRSEGYLRLFRPRTDRRRQ
jgi:lipopolysaccharide/colanic/teichoic acid biosynthesis glycosyltransferase